MECLHNKYPTKRNAFIGPVVLTEWRPFAHITINRPLLNTGVFSACVFIYVREWNNKYRKKEKKVIEQQCPNKSLLGPLLRDSSSCVDGIAICLCRCFKIPTFMAQMMMMVLPRLTDSWVDGHNQITTFKEERWSGPRRDAEWTRKGILDCHRQ